MWGSTAKVGSSAFVVLEVINYSVVMLCNYLIVMFRTKSSGMFQFYDMLGIYERKKIFSFSMREKWIIRLLG